MPKGVKGFQKKAPDVPRMMAAEGGATNEDLEMAHALVALATPTAAKCGAKRRCSDVHSLSEKNWRSERYSQETHAQGLLEKRNVEMTSEKVTLRSKKARAAARLRWEGFVEDEEGTVFEKDATTGALGPGMAAARRTTIGFFFVHNYGSPPESEWGGRGGVIAQIMHSVGVPEGSKAHVRKVLEDVVAAQEKDGAYDASLGLSGSGRQAKITREMAEANVVYTAIGAGVGITEATVMVNEFRAEKDEDSEPVSWGAVKNFIHTCGMVKIHKRAQKKSGKDDSATAWALARLAQALEIQSRLVVPPPPPPPPPTPTPTPTPGPVGATHPRLFLDGIAWWDEFHLKVRLGHASKWEVRLCRHPDTGKVCPEEEGGEWDAEKPNTSIKYPGEARVCAGALMHKATGTEADGVHGGYKGVTLPLFNYTGRTVVGLKAWKKARLAELERVKPLGGWG